MLVLKVVLASDHSTLEASSTTNLQHSGHREPTAGPGETLLAAMEG